MAIINRKPEEKQFVESFTVEQKNKICDLYAEGKNYTEIKHLIYKDFDKDVSKALRQALIKIDIIQNDCTELMYENHFTTKSKLLDALKQKHPDCSVTALSHLLDKIVAVTGTWTEYKISFE